jgi:death on curing protein
MPRSIKWIDHRVVLAIHDEAIARFGGLPGMRDESLLLSALSRPQQAAHYLKPDIQSLAAVYAVGVAKNHAFVDGNKRTALFVAATFLELNGLLLSLREIDAVTLMLDIANGRANEHEVAEIFRQSCSPIGRAGHHRITRKRRSGVDHGR